MRTVRQLFYLSCEVRIDGWRSVFGVGCVFFVLYIGHIVSLNALGIYFSFWPRFNRPARESFYRLRWCKIWLTREQWLGRRGRSDRLSHTSVSRL